MRITQEVLKRIEDKIKEHFGTTDVKVYVDVINPPLDFRAPVGRYEVLLVADIEGKAICTINCIMIPNFTEEGTIQSVTDTFIDNLGRAKQRYEENVRNTHSVTVKLHGISSEE